MTEDFSKSELRRSFLNGTKLDSSDLPSHSQAMEWTVKLTTEASQTVYGFEARHQYITAKVLSQKLRTVFLSKGFNMEQFDSIYKALLKKCLFFLIFLFVIFSLITEKINFKGIQILLLNS